MPRPRRRSDCPIHFALETFGDRWSLLIVRDLLLKSRSTYSEFLRGGERIATNILANRLEQLGAAGIVARQESTGRYLLTEKGAELLPVLLEMIAWSGRHDPQTAAPPEFLRRLREDRAALMAELLDGLELHESAPGGSSRPAVS